MAKKIQGSQRDFSYGEVDVDLKRADDHPARKGGLRQMSNLRIHNSRTIQNRSGRRALFPLNGETRTEEFTLSPGNNFKIGFGTALLRVYDSNGAAVFSSATQGGGAGLPWTAANIGSIVYAIFGLTIYITFPGMRPQALSWNGVSTWSMVDFTELGIGSQKRTPFYRISPQGITIVPSAQTGTITVFASSPVFNVSQVGTRIRFVGRQLLITVFTNSQTVTCTVGEPLPGSQQIAFATNPANIFAVGDVIEGSVSNSKGLVIAFPGGNTMNVQLLSSNSALVPSSTAGDRAAVLTEAFIATDAIVGPGGSLAPSSVGAIGAPLACTVWDEEIMNAYRGYPASCFTDQFRVGFCNFPAVPGGIAWSGINAPSDLYPGANPSDPMFEIAPGKVQIYHVVPGPESSEFVFCDRRIYYIPISPTNPLKPGGVQFQTLSGDGVAQVQPRLAQEAIIYVNAGGNSMMAVIATGAYLRPFNTKTLTDFHGHLFNNIKCIAAPAADGTFNERYAYVLNGDGTIAVGKYDPQSLAGAAPVIGWGPWSGAGTVTWIGAHASDVLFTSSYFGVPIVEILDDTQYLDCALAVNAAPAAFAAPGGKGPLWFIPSQTVSLMDQGTRSMGTYQIDANGFIVPQFNGGENLALASLVAGQPWNWIAEPFADDAAPGADEQQRMKQRRISRFAVYVVHSTGFSLARLFSSRTTPTSPALGTVMNSRRFPAYNIGDDATKPPPQRETTERIRPPGRSFDPRVAVIGDTPGPIEIMELGMEISL